MLIVSKLLTINFPVYFARSVVSFTLSICLVAGLFSTPVVADGLGGLSALPALLALLFAMFTAVWIIIWIALRIVAKTRRKDSPNRYWLRDTDVPFGLRLLGFFQYLLAFIFALSAFTRLILPGHYQNGWIAHWIIHIIVFNVIFCVLAIVSANGYMKRSYKMGFKIGMILGLVCIANLPVYLALHGPYYGLDPITPIFGVVLILLLQLRFRAVFSN